MGLSHSPGIVIDGLVFMIDPGNSRGNPQFAYGTICGTANEGGNLTLTAPAGGVFDQIVYASYGTPDGTCGLYTNGACHATGSTSIVSTYLLNNNTGTIPATNGVFGDPCGGTYKRLYVEARYKYSNSANLTGDSYSSTLVNGIGTTSDNVGSFSFDGTNDFISIPITTGLDTSTVTWSFWYKSSSDTEQVLISKGSSTFFKLTIGPSTITLTNELITIIGEDNGNRVGYITTNRNELFDNRWHHIVFTSQPSFYKLYLDGRDLALTVGAGSNNGNLTNAGSSFFIGTNTVSEFLNGNIGQVQIYNRALSATEIRQNYNATRKRYGI
jgi:hypothetical protein